LLRKKRPSLNLKPNEGVVLFSGQFTNRDNPDQKNIFWVNSLALQEVNQYLPHGRRKPYLIPYPSGDYIKQDDLFLFSLKLPRGTYKITSFNGMFRTFFATQYFVSVNRIFDVVPGQINYAGRLSIEFFMYDRQKIHDTILLDEFDEDQCRFKNGYPALQNLSIVKDLIY